LDQEGKTTDVQAISIENKALAIKVSAKQITFPTK